MGRGDTEALRGLATGWPWAGIRYPVLRNALALLAFGLCYLAAYSYGMSFSPAVSAPFWFPDAVLLGALLCIRPRWWWLPLALVLPIRLAVTLSPDSNGWFLATVYVNDCLKAALAAALLRRYLTDPLRFNSVHDFGTYLLVAVLLAPTLSAFGGAAARAMLGHSFWPSFEQWLLGDAMATLVLAPILFYWVLRPPDPSKYSAMQFLEAALLTCGLLITLWLAFEPAASPHSLAETRYYAPMPFIVWAAFRFGMTGATAAAGMLSFFAVRSALDQDGQFSGLAPGEVSHRLQHFLLLRVAPLYLAAVLVEQWKAVTDSLRESEQRFRIIADQSPMMMWTSGPDAGCEFANRGWLDFAGRTLEQTVGEGWSHSVHPDDRQRTFETYLGQFRERRPLQMEYRARRHDGEYRWIAIHGTPRLGTRGEFLGYIGSAIDVTDQREQEAALRRSESRYRDLVENQHGFICRLLPDGELTFINSTYCHFLGRSRLDVLGTPFVDLLPASAHAAARDAIGQALHSSVQAGWECEVARADGSRGWQRWMCHALEAGPEDVREVQVIGYDITDQKRAEESGRQLAHAARFAVVGELTAMVAHEVNQPLCAILSNAEAGEILLRSDSPPLEELRQIFADIRNDDLRADAAIRGIRSLLNRREMVMASVDLADTVHHVMKLTGGDALHRRVNMRSELAADLPYVLGDRSRLEQVFVILILNAMDAMNETAEDSRALVISARRGTEGFVEVAVRDFGHGISGEHMPQLFDSLFTTKPEGMGLGLPIARTIVQSHGGTICAENAPGGGAVVRFSLRIDPESPGP